MEGLLIRQKYQNDKGDTQTINTVNFYQFHNHVIYQFSQDVHFLILFQPLYVNELAHSNAFITKMHTNYELFYPIFITKL